MLTPEDLAKLDAAAKAKGVDPVALRAAAEEIDTPLTTGGQPRPGQPQGQREPKLFMYLLPFVKVSEVRKVFLGLDEAFEGDAEIASDWATDHPLIGAKAETVDPETGATDGLADDEIDVGDAMPGDAVRLNDDGWHAFAGDKHVGGPYKRHALALRRLRKFDRSYRKK